MAHAFHMAEILQKQERNVLIVLPRSDPTFLGKLPFDLETLNTCKAQAATDALMEQTLYQQLQKEGFY